MSVFRYEGLQGERTVKGTVEAPTKKEALLKLKMGGISPLKIEEEKGRFSKLKPVFRQKEKSPPEEYLAFILLQLSILLEAGVSLPQALEQLSQSETKIGAKLLQIKLDIDRGKSISQAFRDSKIFPEFLSEMLMAAETGENLERVFHIAGSHLETVSDMKSRLTNALIYPSVVIAFSVVSLFVAIKVIVPKIASILSSMGRDLPLLTKAILAISGVTTYLLLAIPILIILYMTFREKISRVLNPSKLILEIPIIGKIILCFDLSRFAYTLFMTLSAAVPITNAFQIGINSMSNTFLKERLSQFVKDIEKGISLSTTFKNSGVLPATFINLIETGENSGELEKMLGIVAKIYREEALRSLNLWIRLIEPVSILVIGIIVGLIAVSVILPLTEVTAGFRK